jgi:hypothetical protein
MNDILKLQFELLSKWMAHKVDLEAFNEYANRWEPMESYSGDTAVVIRRVRERIPIECPSEIYVNIYKNGTMFAHKSEKEAELAIDSEWPREEVVTKLYNLGED